MAGHVLRPQAWDIHMVLGLIVLKANLYRNVFEDNNGISKDPSQQR